MVEKRKPLHFKVQYQLVGKKEAPTRDYLLKDLPEVMRMLYLNEGVTTDKCAFIYIHMYAEDSTVTEVLSYEKPKNKLPVPVTSKPATVIDKVKEAVISSKSHGTNRYIFMEAT